MKKNDLRLERKKQRREDNKIFILRTAERIMAQKGYSSTSMDDIAAEAQFSKATLYRYFTSKGKLFFEIIVNSIDELNKKLRAVQNKDAKTDKKLKGLIRVLVEHLDEKENISRIFVVDKFLREKLQFIMTGDQSTVSLIEKKFLKKIQSMRGETLSLMSNIVSSGTKSGEFRQVNAEDTAVMIESIVNGYFYGRHWQDKKYNLEKGIDLIHQYLLIGIKKKKAK